MNENEKCTVDTYADCEHCCVCGKDFDEIEALAESYEPRFQEYDPTSLFFNQYDQLFQLKSAGVRV